MNENLHENCPYCGGVLTIDHMQLCPHCSVLLTLGGVSLRTMIKSRITREQASNVIAGLLRYKFILKATGIRCKFTGCNLKYVPFWKIKWYISGQMDGYADEGDEVAYMVPARREVFKTFTCIRIANDSACFGVYGLRDIEGESVPYDTCLGQTLEVTVSREDAIAKCRIKMEKLRARIFRKEKLFGDLYGNIISNICVCPFEVSLIYYPLLIVEYSFLGAVFQATVDGVTGELLALTKNLRGK